jgi:hypothetical protein
MTPLAPQFANDSESLQADVMRFMAIIAFCLIAILALVRNAEPPVEQAKPPEPATSPEPQVAMQIEPEPVTPPPAPLPREPEPAVEPPPPEPVEVTAMEEPALVEIPVAEVVEKAPEPAPLEAEPASEPTPEPADGPPAPTAEPEEEGLILRFASDRDFLRLIARGDIRVYAYADDDVLGLDGSYRFLDTAAPGEVYELLIASIPELVLDSLRRERSDIRPYRWGIALPDRISSQIEAYLERVEHGQLIIDRYGDVHHVAAS